MLMSVNVLSISRRHIFAAVCANPHRDYCNNVREMENAELPSLRRGTGGRSSFSGTVATVFGATGFMGRYLVNELGKTGAQVIIPYRSEPDDYDVKRLKLCGDLGQILFQPFDLRDPISIRKAIKYSNTVFNLIGLHFETKNFNFHDVHVKGAREIAIACREMNINRLIHVSSLNVTDKPKAYFLPKPLEFLSSKLKGERAVLEEFPEATIFRPAIIFGRYDRFLWALNARQRRTFDSFPLWAAGKKTVKQPVYIHDVINGLVAALKNDESRGKIYQAVGPERFLMSEIADYSGRVAFRTEGSYHHDARFDPYFIIKTILSRYILARFWHYPRWDLCFEQIEMESVTDELDQTLPTLEDLGVKLTRLEDRGENLIRARYLIKGSHFRDRVHYEPIRPPVPHATFF